MTVVLIKYLLGQQTSHENGSNTLKASQTVHSFPFYTQRPVRTCYRHRSGVISALLTPNTTSLADVYNTKSVTLNQISILKAPRGLRQVWDVLFWETELGVMLKDRLETFWRILNRRGLLSINNRHSTQCNSINPSSLARLLLRKG